MPSRLETREELNSDLIPIEFDFQSYFVESSLRRKDRTKN
jgi:hypothetical protein